MLPAQIAISFSSDRLRAKDPLVFDVLVRNISREGFYFCGDISPGVIASPCHYQLQVRSDNKGEFRTTMQIAADVGPGSKELSSSEFKERWNLFLLQPGYGLSRRYSGTWAGLTALPAGTYEVRLIYNGYETQPFVFDHPLLRGPIVSNVVKVEVSP